MALPVDLGAVTIVAEYRDEATGALLAGTVTFTPQTPQIASSAIRALLPAPLIATVTAGALSVVLPVSNDPDYPPAGAYLVTENLAGVTNRAPYLIQIDSSLAGTTVQLLGLAASPTYTVSFPYIQVIGPGIEIGSTLDVTGAVDLGAGLSMAGHLSVLGHALGVPQPSDCGYKAWVMDPMAVSAGSTLIAGSVYLAAIYVAQSITVTSIWIGVTTAPGGLTAGQNKVGIYNSAGTLLVSASIDAVATSTGAKQVTIGSTVLAPGTYWLAVVANPSSGNLGLASGEANTAVRAIVNAALTAANLREAVAATGQTTLPGSITPASNSTTGILPLWMAVS